MQTDYENLKDAFEMSELLEDYTKDSLEILMVNADDTRYKKVTFSFNEDQELVGVVYDDV